MKSKHQITHSIPLKLLENQRVSHVSPVPGVGQTNFVTLVGDSVMSEHC